MKKSAGKSLDEYLADDIQEMNTELGKSFLSVGRILLLVGRTNLRAFQKTNAFKSSWKFRLNELTYFQQFWHGVVIQIDGIPQHIVFLLCHPEWHLIEKKMFE
jgi:hypothetical protein